MTRKLNLSKDDLKEKIDKGMMVKDIANQYGCSRTTISKYLKEYGLLSKQNEKRENNQKILDKNRDFIINEYNNNNKSLKEIGNELQISPTTIKNFLIKNNIKIKNNSECHRQLKLNEHYFDKIDTLEKAYILGFICADGWVSNNSNVLGFTIHNKDKEVLHFIKEELESEAPIKNI